MSSTLDELIRSFARDNFGPQYRVAPQGRNNTIEPLTLIVKHGKPWHIRQPKIVLEPLECFLDDGKPNLKEEVRELAKLNLRNGPVFRTAKGAEAGIETKGEVVVGEHFKIAGTKKHDLGELSLGNVQEEFYKETGLRAILHKAFLDPVKMLPYEKEKLYIITGVVYSDRLRVLGARRKEDTIDAEAKAPSMPFLTWCENVAAVKARLSRVLIPTQAIGKTARSPLLFTYARLEYQKEEKRLQVKKGVFIGAKLKPRDVVADNDGKEENEDNDDDEMNDAEELTAEDLDTFAEFVQLDDDRDFASTLQDLYQSTGDNSNEKLEIVLNFLSTTKNIKEMKTRLNFVLHTINYAMSSPNGSMRTEVPMSESDQKLMTEVGLTLERGLNSAKVFRVSNENREQVRDYGLIFQHLQEIGDEEWDAVKQFADQIKEERTAKDEEEN
ncbi:uncharacterized protein LOC5501698 [Nematostella vectensis]|uniref:uncharacterized protein LOC5501698 n=1 Tax=Nematostella vectensis TaxID=45351 RepID=UPI0020776C78|nr:uncharacterized protein LOC5501698 [Nematostella vectensis]